jgi:excisionase family DNA binding protein
MMSDNFVPIGEVADKFSVSKHTVRQWLRKGKIPEDLYVKIGNTYRYNLQGIENTFLSTNKDVSEVVEEAVSEFEFGTDMLDEDF